MKKYEYKKSGIEWLGDIPTHWKRDKLFRLCNKISSGGTPKSSNETYYGGDIAWIQSGDLTDFYVFETQKTITEKGLKNSSAKMFPKKTLLIAMYGATIGKLGIMEIDAAINQACCALDISTKLNSKYTYYLLLNIRDFLINQAYGGGQPNISQEIIKQQYLYYPPTIEQKAIAEYLDRTCEKIDRIISIKEKQLEKIEEFYLSKIHEALTKGINSNVELVQSNIDWLGEIPKHWKIRKIKRCFDVLLGKMIQPNQKNEDDTEEKYLRSANITWNGVDTSNIKTMWFKPFEKLKYKLQVDDLLVSEGGDVGRSSIWNEEVNNCYFQNAINRVRGINSNNTKFLYYWMFLLKKVGYIDTIVSRITIAHLTAEKLDKLTFIVPPVKEQNEIVKYLENVSKQTKLVEKKVEAQIETLKSYRKSLIHECVTGKKQVYQMPD